MTKIRTRRFPMLLCNKSFWKQSVSKGKEHHTWSFDTMKRSQALKFSFDSQDVETFAGKSNQACEQLFRHFHIPFYKAFAPCYLYSKWVYYVTYAIICRSRCYVVKMTLLFFFLCKKNVFWVFINTSVFWWVQINNKRKF